MSGVSVKDEWDRLLAKYPAEISGAKAEVPLEILVGVLNEAACRAAREGHPTDLIGVCPWCDLFRALPTGVWPQ